MPKHTFRHSNSPMKRTQGKHRPANSSMMIDMEKLKKEQQAASSKDMNVNMNQTRVTPPAKHRNVSEPKTKQPSVGKGRKFSEP